MQYPCPFLFKRHQSKWRNARENKRKLHKGLCNIGTPFVEAYWTMVECPKTVRGTHSRAKAQEMRLNPNKTAGLKINNALLSHCEQTVSLQNDVLCGGFSDVL